MDPEVKSSIMITYDGNQYEVEYIYYSISPDDFEVRKIYDASACSVNAELYREIELYCQSRLLEEIREELMTRAE